MTEENQAEEQFENEEAAPDEKKILMQRLRLMGVKFSNAASVETLRAKLREKLGVTDEETEIETTDEDGEDEINEGEKTETEEVEELTTSENTPPVVDTDAGPTQDLFSEQPETASVVETKLADNGISQAEREELETLRAQLAEMQKTAAAAESKEELNPLAGDKAGQKPSKHMTTRDRVRKEALKLVRVRIANMDPKKKDLPGEVLTIGNKYIGTVKKYIPYSAEQTENGYHIPKVLFDELDSRKYLHIRTFKDRVTGQQRQETSYQKEFALEVLPPLTVQELAELAADQRARGSVG